MTNKVNIDPTPEFQEKCTIIMRAWQAGDLEFEKASANLRNLQQDARDRTYLPDEARAEFIFGFMQGYRSNLTLSEKHFQQAREMYANIGDQARHLSCVLNLGEIARQRGDFGRAHRLFDEAYDTAKTMDDELDTQTIALANKGQALFSVGKSEQAQEALEIAYDLYEQLPEDKQNPSILIEVQQCLALIYLERDDIEKAWFSAKQAFYFAREANQPLPIGLANRIMAEILTELQEIPVEDRDDFPLDVDSYFQEAMQAFQSLDAEGERARTMFAQAKSLGKRGRQLQAARRLQEATIIFSRLGMVDDATKAAELQSQIF